MKRNETITDSSVYNFSTFLNKSVVFTPVMFLQKWMSSHGLFRHNLENYKKSNDLPNPGDFFIFETKKYEGGVTVLFYQVGIKFRRSYRATFEQVFDIMLYLLDLF